MSCSLAVRCAPAVVAVLAVLMGACGAEPSRPAHRKPATAQLRPEVRSRSRRSPCSILMSRRFRVGSGCCRKPPTTPLRWTVDGTGSGCRTRCCTQVDLPDDSEVVRRGLPQPSLRGDSGPNGLLWIELADNDTALPVHPCRTTPPSRRTHGRRPGHRVERPAFPHRHRTRRGHRRRHEGLFVTVTVPDDADVSTCQDGSVDLIATSPHTWKRGTVVDRIWILDVDGARHVIHARVTTACTTPAQRQAAHPRHDPDGRVHHLHPRLNGGDRRPPAPKSGCTAEQAVGDAGPEVNGVAGPGSQGTRLRPRRAARWPFTRSGRRPFPSRAM